MKIRLLRFACNDKVLGFVFVCAVFASLAKAQVTITPTETTPSQETVHRAKNLNLLTDEEKLHVPVIVLPTNIRAGKPFRMEIMVGKTLHPMTDEHYIEWIEVWAGDTRIARTELSPGVSVPDISVSLTLSESALLRVFARCNTHGLWEGNIKVTIKQPTVIPQKTGGK